MIIIKEIDDHRTYIYSDKNKWIRQIETGNEYETVIDYIPHTYEELDRDIENAIPVVDDIIENSEVI